MWNDLSKKLNIIYNIITCNVPENHKSKWNNSKPSLTCFKNEFKIYLVPIKHLSKDNQSLCKLYKNMYESLSF